MENNENDEFWDMPVLSPITGEVEEWLPPEENPTHLGEKNGDNQSGKGKRKFHYVKRDSDKERLEELNKYNKELEPTDFHGPGWECISAAQSVSQRFHLFNFLSRFLILNCLYPEGDYPEERLRKMFYMCVDYIKNAAKEAGITPNRWLIIINSDLMDHSVPLDLHSIDEDTAEVILHKFMDIDQSGEQRGKDSLVTQEFVIQIGAIEAIPVGEEMESAKRIKHLGRGKTDNESFKHNFNRKALIEVNNEDNFCLFRACEILRKRAIISNPSFTKYLKNKEAQDNDVENLIEVLGIDPNLEAYDIETYGQKIQDYYDQQHPGMFRIFVFNEYGTFKPFWISERDNRFVHPISLIYWNEQCHYDAIKFPGKLFKESNRYCFACKMPFRSLSDHRFNCDHRCKNCLQIGPSYPCLEDGKFDASCLDCNKHFTSKPCYDHHIKSGACKKHKKCLNCSVSYDVRLNKKNGRDGHVCGEKNCRKCHRYHGIHPCYIQPIKMQKEKHKRFIAGDFECKTGIKPHPKWAGFLHEVNYIYAHVFCTLCVANNTWDKPLLKKCIICGSKRFFTWAPFGYETVPVDQHYVTDNPLKDFTKWVLTYFKVKTAQKQKRKGTKRQEEDIESPNEMECSVEEEEVDDNSLPDPDVDPLVEMGIVPEDGVDPETEVAKKMREYESIVYMHNGGRYDNIMIFGELFRMGGLNPRLVRQNNRLYEIEVRKRGIVNPTLFRDTFNIIPLKLAKFPETFGLKIDGIEGKQWFPYSFNRDENYNITFPTLPEKKFYNADGLLKKARESFDLWYDENKDTPFNLNETLASYCRSDVQILAHGFVKMREMFMAKTGMDIARSLTISSACMKFFRTTIDENYLAITPHLGYDFQGNQSSWARKYIKWLQHTRGYDIQHCDTDPQGEFQYRNYFLDGYVRREGMRDLAIELNGCFYHACPRPECYGKLTDEDVLNGRRVGDIRAYDEAKYEAIREEMDLEIIWECQVKEEIKKNIPCIACPENIKTFMNNTPDTGPIKFREGFFGGRTGPEWMYNSVFDAEHNPEGPKRTMKFKDFCSLYPAMNFHTYYPTGHPKWTVVNKKVNWTNIGQCREVGLEPNGLFKCWVVPPRHIPFPVLLNRFGDERLLFTLCRTCAKQNRNGKRNAKYSCPHTTDKMRGFIVTATGDELDWAFRCHYRVTHIYRAYSWEGKQMDNNVFKEYVRKWMHLKYTSSGWPPDIEDPSLSEEERSVKKQEYVDDAKRLYGIVFTIDEVEFNPGMKYLAKMALNSLWGRFALRNRLSQSVICTNDVDLSKYLNDYKIEISYFEQLSEEALMLIYKTKEEFVTENESSNLMLALYTTSAARCHLFEHVMELLKNTDVRILYMDTDSILYDYNAENDDPITDGTHLGELADQFPNHHIIEYVCGASKAYSLKLKHKQTGEISFETKCRGVTIDCRNADKFNHEVLKKHVQNFMDGIEEETLTLDYPDKFRIDPRGEIATVPMKKKFQCVINKGILREGGEIVPFGWSPYNESATNKKYYKENESFFNSKYDSGPNHPVRKELLDMMYKEFPRYHPITNPGPSPRVWLGADPHAPEARLIHDIIREEDPWAEEIDE